MCRNSKVEDAGMPEVEKFFLDLPGTLHVDNVQDDQDYRNVDVDLIWIRRRGIKVKASLVEVKINAPFKTDDFFLEVISNKGKGTPGAILYSEADFFAYLFLGRKELYIMPAAELRYHMFRYWQTYQIKQGQTKLSPEGNVVYASQGMIIPEPRIMSIPGVKKFTLDYADKGQFQERVEAKIAPVGSKTYPRIF